MESVYPNLSDMMIKCGTTYSDLAHLIFVAEDVISQKMKGLIPWSLTEALSICFYFHTSDVDFLFLQLDTNT